MRADAAPFVPSVLLNSSTCECTNKQQRQRGRRRGKQGALAEDITSSYQQNEPQISYSQTRKQTVQQQQQQEQLRRGRARRRIRDLRRNNTDDVAQSQSLLNCQHSMRRQSKIEDTSAEHTTIIFNDDRLHYTEDFFPTLTTTKAHTCISTNNKHADGSWGESLAVKLATSLEIEQRNQDDRVQHNEEFNSDLHLTKLSRTFRWKKDNETIDIIGTQHTDKNEHYSEAAQPSNDNENDSTLVPNARWKWNDTQISKMRQRWWDAAREKQVKDAERVKQRKTMTSFSTDELEVDSATSSSTSSSLLSIIEDNDPLEPPSLNKPFDESPVHQTSNLLERPPRVPKSVLDLEAMCCETEYPIHTIIYLHAQRNPFVDNRHGLAGSAEATAQKESVDVLRRLLKIHDQENVKRWLMERVSLDELSRYRTPSALDKTQASEVVGIISVDNEMTPLQLAIVLNCPDILRVLVSSMSTYFISNKNENEKGCTPLMLACELGNVACIKTLLCTSNIKLDYRERGGGNTAYHFCCLNQNNNVSALDTLMSHTPNALQKRVLLSTNRDGRNLLHLACARGNLSLLKCVLGHLSNVSAQMPWKALSMIDRLGHSPFISAVYADECEIVAHLLVTRFPSADYKVWFSACPLTVAASIISFDMATLLFEMGYDAQSTKNSILSPIIRYDINRSLLELMLIKLGMDESEEKETHNYELIRLLVDHGANPYSAVSMSTPLKPKTRGDTAIATLTSEEDTPLSVAVVAGDFLSIECMMHSYTQALTLTQSLRRNDPVLIAQPESYFRAVEERENITTQQSLQTALAKALFLTWQDGRSSLGKCCLTLYRRGVTLSEMSMQWLEKCISVQRLVPPTSIPIDSMGAYFFEAPVVQYFLPTALKGLNPFDSVNTSLCWSHILLDLPWTNKFSFNCKWIRNMKSNFNSDRFKNDLLDDEIYLVTESESLLVHKSILSARSGKLAAAIRFTEAQELCVAEDGKLSVRIDLPLQLAKMLLCHCYHGSMSFGLVACPLKRSEQLLKLALVAEEYLCPSLLAEVEMRLLETKSSDCFCAYCSGTSLSSNVVPKCPVTRQYLVQAGQNVDECETTGVYFYKASRFNTNSPSSLISPESALNILATAQQLELSSCSQNGSYALKYTKCQESVASTCINVERDMDAGVLTAPFLACKSFAVLTLLRDFKAFMQHSKEEDDAPLIADERDAGLDDNHVLLLRTCLEELAQNPLRRRHDSYSKNLSARWLHWKQARK